MPKRVVSMNLCTDQLAMLLAAPGQLVSVSPIATDPHMSPLWDEAADYHMNSGRAEAIYLLEPDVVLANEYSDPMAVQMLRNLGIEVVQFANITTLDEVPGQIREMGEVLGQIEKAESMAADVEATLAERTVNLDERPIAAFFYANGYSLGVGTLSHDIITRAGFRNLAEELGRSGGGNLSLEDLLMNRPDILITAGTYAGASRAEAIMGHAALAEIPRLESTADWVCATPFLMDALDDMIAAREALTKD